MSLSSMALAQSHPITIRAGTVLDGKGGVLRHAAVGVEGSKIQSVGRASGPATYDFPNLTILPGMIDTPVHIAWHFGPDNRFSQRRDEPQSEAMGYAVENAYVTLMAGFTTVQSLCNPIDKDVRDAIARGVLPGARVRTL
jgi:imidazolonepropionase-like amidohydrolase